MHSAFIYRYGHLTRASLIVKWVKNLPAMQETQELPVPSVGQEDSLEKAIATHSNILAWEIPWTEEPGRLHSTGSQRVRHDRVTVTQSCPTLCDPMDCSTPGFPVLHHLLEFSQTHVH